MIGVNVCDGGLLLAGGVVIWKILKQKFMSLNNQ